MGVNHLTELTRIRRVLRPRVPTDGLRIGFGYEVVRAFQRTTEIARHPDAARIESLLCFEVRVFRNDVETSRNCPLIEVRVNSAAKVLRDELIGTLVLAHDIRLPGQ